MKRGTPEPTARRPSDGETRAEPPGTPGAGPAGSDQAQGSIGPKPGHTGGGNGFTRGGRPRGRPTGRSCAHGNLREQGTVGGAGTGRERRGGNDPDTGTGTGCAGGKSSEGRRACGNGASGSRPDEGGWPQAGFARRRQRRPPRRPQGRRAHHGPPPQGAGPGGARTTLLGRSAPHGTVRSRTGHRRDVASGTGTPRRPPLVDTQRCVPARTRSDARRHEGARPCSLAVSRDGDALQRWGERRSPSGSGFGPARWEPGSSRPETRRTP